VVGGWDELEVMVKALPAPLLGLVDQRHLYEGRVGAALPILGKQPQLPASNAAVEAQIRLTLEPFVENRGHRYRNLARTNFLCDLAVCRSQGLFSDPDKLAALIRASNEDAGGWAPQPRGGRRAAGRGDWQAQAWRGTAVLVAAQSGARP
jgi:hypothetical protein